MVRKRQEERHHRGGKQKMRKLGMKIAVAAAVFCMAMPFASFAGTWKSDANGMWYQFDDGSYPKGRWAWIDTDNDGMAESFYFDENGYVLRNTTTPDGYQVNRIGAWVVGGEVKQKAGGERTAALELPETVAVVPTVTAIRIIPVIGITAIIMIRTGI